MSLLGNIFHAIFRLFKGLLVLAIGIVILAIAITVGGLLWLWFRWRGNPVHSLKAWGDRWIGRGRPANRSRGFAEDVVDVEAVVRVQPSHSAEQRFKIDPP